MNILDLKRKLLPLSGPQMDGGGSSSTGGGTQIQELPEWARPYAKNTLEKGAALSERPYQAYDAPRIAGFSPMQQQAQQNAANMQTSGLTGLGGQVAGEAAMRGLGTQYEPGQFQNQFQAPDQYRAGRFRADRIGTQSFTQPGTAESYMNPYAMTALQPTLEEQARQSAIQGQNLQAKAVGQGAFGGSRQAIEQAENARNLGMLQNKTISEGMNTAYNNAMQQFNADQARRLQAQQANQQYGLQAQQLGEQSRQFGAGQGLQAASLGAQYGQAAQQLGEQSRQYGAGLGLQGLQTALTGAGQLGTLGGQEFQQGMDINKLQSAYGGQQQALRQQGLSQAYEDFQNQQNYPYKQLGFMSDLIRGLPLGQQTARQMYEPTPTAAQQIGSIGLGAYGLSKFMASGGMAYADGGSVESPQNIESIVSKLSDQQLQQSMQAAKARGDADQMEAIQTEMAMRASERRGIASGITPQMADRMAGGGVVAFAKGGSSAYLDKLSTLGETDISETPEERLAGINAALPGIQKQYGESALKPYMEDVKKERAGLSKMSDEGEGLGALAASQALLRPGSTSRAVAGAFGAFGGEIAKMKKEQREADRLLRQSEITLATAEQARADGQIGKAEAAYDKSQAQKKEGLDRKIGIAEKQATIQAGIENSQRQAAATMAGHNRPTDLDKQAQALYEAKVAKDPSIATNPVKKAEAMSDARATAADQLGRYPGSARVEAATVAAENKATAAANTALDNALKSNRPYIVAMQKGDWETAGRIREQVAGVLASQKPKGEKTPAPASAPSITVGGQTFTRPANFTDAQWEAYKKSQGVK